MLQHITTWILYTPTVHIAVDREKKRYTSIAIPSFAPAGCLDETQFVPHPQRRFSTVTASIGMQHIKVKKASCWLNAKSLTAFQFTHASGRATHE